MWKMTLGYGGGTKQMTNYPTWKNPKKVPE
jgi:hypothetical protein